MNKNIYNMIAIKNKHRQLVATCLLMKSGEIKFVSYSKQDNYENKTR